MEFTADSNNNAGGFLVDPNSSFGQFAVAIGSGASRNLALFTRPSAGVWHHYAFVLDTTQAGATEITPYVDGQAVNYTKAGVSGTGAGVFANSTLYLMSRAGTTLFGTGDLDEVALYNQALSSSTISNHYLDGAAPAATTATSLSGPATSSVGNAIPASAVSASLSGAATGASGTMTFKVFGPQSSAPTTCSSGGTTVGTPVTVTGNGTYNPGSTFTPTAAGTYWWYASYSGDSANNPSASSCGSGMASTVVGATATTTSASGPASSNAGTAIGASAISATLSGAAGNAGGTITFKVFGPQASAPTTCSTGGTTVGSAVTVSGNGNYNPSAGYTPTAIGTYWWYASYSGDANNNASTSACGSNMSSTVVSTATPTVGASGPASGTAGTSIAASALSANLSGAAAGAGGTVTFKVFGPQASAPTTCTTGGTAIGSAVTVSGNGTYHPTAGFTPATSGTYWWYASYTGDANNQAATSACGSGMTQTTVAGVTTTTSAAAPATGSTNAAIATSAVSGTLSGALSGAGGTMTFKVFGPQATAPSTCSSGGTTVGTAVTVTGNGTYHPNATFTPTTGGNYWWYASYSGDASNQGSSSACGSAMQETIVYDVTSLANATTTTFGSTSAATQQTFTIAPNTTYLLAIYRQSGSSDSVTSITSSGFTPALSLSSFTLAASQNYNTSSYQWAYYLTTGASASGSGRLTVNFARSLGSGQVTIVDLLRLQGNSLSNPFVSASTSKTTGNGSTATANLLAAPGAQDAGIVTVTAPTDLGTPAPNGSPAMTRQFYSHQFQGTLEILSLVPAKQNESFGLGTFTSWGTFALEVAHG
jgi:hypothetical protein